MGLTATGRATVAVLHMNRPLIRAIRDVEATLGRHPPSVGFWRNVSREVEKV